MVNLLKIFNRYKMKAKELQQENEGLKAQIIGLSFNLQQADKQIQFLQSELDKANKQNKELANDIQYTNMKLNNIKDKNDSRYY
jgi:chromosome segregation ATPase